MTTERSLLATAEGLEEDRGAYLRVVNRIVSRWSDYEPVVLGPFLPRPNRLLHAVDFSFARAGLSSAHGLAKRFRSERARALLAGHAAHSMLPLETRPSGGVGLFLIATAHVFGWGFPRSGSQRLADALADRLQELGGEIRTASPVDELPRADVVLADVVPRELLRIAGDRLPAHYALRFAGTGTARESSSSTGRSTARSPGRRPIAGARRPCTSAARSRRSPSPSARRARAATRSARTSC